MITLNLAGVKMETIKSMKSLFFTFSYFHKMEKVPESLFRQFGHALRTRYQSFESFSDSVYARKTSHHEKET